MTECSNRQTGLTLIELVMVIVVVSILSLVAIPRYLEIAEEAKIAALQGLAGNYSAAVLSARAQWEADGKPSQQQKNWVEYDGTRFSLTSAEQGSRAGYPFALALQGYRAFEQLTDQDCLDLIDNLLQSPPPATVNETEAASGRYQYFVRADVVSGQQLCRYYQLASARDFWTGMKSITAGHVFTYTPALGRVDMKFIQNI
ncbi:type II secretion system protein [Photobacterium sp. GJ3]|uniref:pilus assembly FimT family protein n=1 Tax=Photobacterium sp. GJ3 TaxID=2829502 RepID=UPI001B8C7567|nr:type II secretion system protein [Photobacterium sp. GJ3]QUJ67144.1 type II secretion system protein [Photobacterium sp. GJ3]